MKSDWFESKGHFWHVSILLAISYFFLMFGNGLLSLTHPDEVFYIESAKDMLRHGRWFTPMIFDEVQFEKPFVSFALFAAAIKWFGLSSFVARFWPAFFGIVGVLTVYWIAWLLFRQKRLAFLAGLILSTSFIYVALSRAVLTDMIFSIFVAITMGFFVLAYFRPEYKSAGLIFCAVFSAIAVLTKGLLGFLFPTATILIFLIFERNLKFLKTPVTLWALLVFLLLALPWHIVMYLNHGQWFLDEYFGNVHWRRVLEAEHPRLNKWYFYPGLMFAGVLPWSLFWLPAIVSIREHFKKKTSSWSGIAFLLAWMLSVFIFIQPAASKLASYIFPLFPAVAILLAMSVDEMFEPLASISKIRQRLFKSCAYVMSVALVAAAIGGFIVGRKYINFLVSMTPVYIGGGFVVMMAVLIFIFNRQNNFARMVVPYSGLSLTLLLILLTARPYIEPWVSCKDISEVFKKIDQSDSTVLTSKFYVRGMRFYTDRPMAVIDINGKPFWSPHPVPFLDTEQDVLDFLKKQPVTYAVVKEGNVEDLKRIAQSGNYRLKELGGMGGKYILRIESGS